MNKKQVRGFAVYILWVSTLLMAFLRYVWPRTGLFLEWGIWALLVIVCLYLYFTNRSDT